MYIITTLSSIASTLTYIELNGARPFGTLCTEIKGIGYPIDVSKPSYSLKGSK